MLLGHFQPGTGGPEGQQGLDVLTMTRSAFLQVRCAFVAQMERAVLTLHRLFGRLPAKLDSKSRLRRA